MAIRAVCFDATGTLIELRESVGTVYSRAARDVGVALPAWRLDDAFARVRRRAPPLALASASGTTRAEREAAELEWWSERVRQTFQATDSTVQFADPKGFARTLFESYRSADAWRLRPGAVALLTRLRAGGLRLAVVSQFDHRLPDILEVMDLKGFFDRVSIPIDGLGTKPERALFEALAVPLGARLDELAYVGDDAPEVLAAIAGLGLRVFDVRDLPDLAALADPLVAGASGSDR